MARCRRRAGSRRRRACGRTLTVRHESAMLLRSAVARAITARSSALRACSRWSSRALRCAALTNPSPIPGIRHRKGALGRRGWAGPMPVRSHGRHAYAFQVFALDQAPGLPASFTLDDVIAAIKGHAIGRARLDGTYEIRYHPEQRDPGSRRGHTGRATLTTAFRSRIATGTAARTNAPVRANAAG